MKKFGNFTHRWTFDLPWHMVDLRDWLYMVNVGCIDSVTFLHVRIAGIRSLWEFINEPDRAAEQRDEAGGGDALPKMEPCGNCGTPRFIHGVVLEACSNCGDDETDLSLRMEIP